MRPVWCIALKPRDQSREAEDDKYGGSFSGERDTVKSSRDMEEKRWRKGACPGHWVSMAALKGFLCSALALEGRPISQALHTQ